MWDAVALLQLDGRHFDVSSKLKMQRVSCAIFFSLKAFPRLEYYLFLLFALFIWVKKKNLEKYRILKNITLLKARIFEIRIANRLSHSLHFGTAIFISVSANVLLVDCQEVFVGIRTRRNVCVTTLSRPMFLFGELWSQISSVEWIVKSSNWREWK